MVAALENLDIFDSKEMKHIGGRLIEQTSPDNPTPARLWIGIKRLIDLAERAKQAPAEHRAMVFEVALEDEGALRM